MPLHYGYRPYRQMVPFLFYFRLRHPFPPSPLDSSMRHRCEHLTFFEPSRPWVAEGGIEYPVVFKAAIFRRLTQSTYAIQA